VVSTAFIRDFLIGEADIASFSCYSKPPASAGGAFTQDNRPRHADLAAVFDALLQQIDQAE
jgi:alpha-D-ribose 1-methylphosphonate 5-triphosphate synthase subunit PhnG